MEISNGGINNPVNMYTTATGNNLNLAVESENKIYGSNIFSSEFTSKENSKTTSLPIKRKRKSKRLNTIDTDFLPDETVENSTQETKSNFFVEKTPNKYKQKLKNTIEKFLTSTPLINCIYLKQKEQKIQKTVETLNDIMQNADELINTAVPYGENGKIYQNIAQNLTKAAIVIGKANKEF